MTDDPTVNTEEYIGSRIDHLNITVTDIARSRRFYELTLGSIGIEKILDVGSDTEHRRPPMVGFGCYHKPFFWLVQGRPGPTHHRRLPDPGRCRAGMDPRRADHSWGEAGKLTADR